MEITETRYPIGVQSFEKIRTEGYVYVDKTGFIPKLLRNEYHFMSRPRRFGKSLLLSTLEAYFRGKKELFEGLEISKYEKDWVEYPVVHIDFASMNVDTTEDLVLRLLLQIQDIAESYGMTIPAERQKVDLAFGYLVSRLAQTTGKKVVVLIDEYDKGIIEVLDDEKLMVESTKVLRPFFSVLKSHDRYIRFAFVTGELSFRCNTIFSGCNNLYDISMSPEFAAICGITSQELEAYFGKGIDRVAEKHGCSHNEAVDMLLLKYGGYRFSDEKEYVCNPFSVLNAFDSGFLKNYWGMSRPSKIMAECIRQNAEDIEDMTSRWVSSETLGDSDYKEDPRSLLYQTGYLTIADSNGWGGYRLRIPNEEVKASLASLFHA